MIPGSFTGGTVVYVGAVTLSLFVDALYQIENEFYYISNVLKRISY